MKELLPKCHILFFHLYLSLKFYLFDLFLVHSIDFNRPQAVTWAIGESKMQESKSQYKARCKSDETLKDRVYLFMESLAQRLKRDGLKLFLLVLANGLYLYLGGIVFYFLERNDVPDVNTKQQVLELIRLITVVRILSIVIMINLNILSIHLLLISLHNILTLIQQVFLISFIPLSYLSLFLIVHFSLLNFIHQFLISFCSNIDLFDRNLMTIIQYFIKNLFEN